MQQVEKIGSSLPLEINADELPESFPTRSSQPRFIAGDRVRWKPLDEETVDFGTVIGHFYAYAEHLARWGWKYLVFLDPAADSRAFCIADTAWEEHLESISTTSSHEFTP